MSEQRAPIVLAPGDGRRYDMGSIRATFLADRRDSVSAYSISTWRLEPHTTGPGPHHHPEDDVFLVTEGTMSFLVDGAWRDAPAGTFVLVPGGATHDFENRSDAPASVFNVSVPGEFEQHMPGIVAWFLDHPPARTSW
jgi:quercetin dioxygenase-like cupin family protein